MDGDTRVSAPSPDGDGLGEVEMCGQVVWPQRETPGGLRRLVAQEGVRPSVQVLRGTHVEVQEPGEG